MGCETFDGEHNENNNDDGNSKLQLQARGGGGCTFTLKRHCRATGVTARTSALALGLLQGRDPGSGPHFHHPQGPRCWWPET